MSADYEIAETNYSRTINYILFEQLKKHVQAELIPSKEQYFLHRCSLKNCSIASVDKFPKQNNTACFLLIIKELGAGNFRII